MRISTSMYFQTGLNTINQQQADLVKLFQQTGTGQRMVTPSDDPLAAAQTINLAQAQAMNQRFGENRGVAQRALSEEENILNSVTLQLQDVQTRLLEAANGTLSDADRNTLATVLQTALDTLVGLANSKDGSGQYLFSGSQGQTAPFQFDGTSYSYHGDTLGRPIQVEQTRQLDSSDHGQTLFMRANPGSLSYMTQAAAGTTGTGVISGPSVSPGNSAGHYRIVFTSPTDYTVEVDGVPDPNGPFTLPSSDKEQTINLASGVSVKFSGQPAAGDQFDVSSAAQTDMNLFDTLQRMADALKTPLGDDPALKAALRNTLNSSIQRVAENYDNVLTVRSSVGTRLNELDALSANGSLRQLNYRQELSRLEDLDYYQASTQLELRKSALEAAALAFRKIQSLNLFGLRGNG